MKLQYTIQGSHSQQVMYELIQCIVSACCMSALPIIVGATATAAGSSTAENVRTSSLENMDSHQTQQRRRCRLL